MIITKYDMLSVYYDRIAVVIRINFIANASIRGKLHRMYL